jgi:hypothetical protein
MISRTVPVRIINPRGKARMEQREYVLSPILNPRPRQVPITAEHGEFMTRDDHDLYTAVLASERDDRMAGIARIA